MVTNPEVQLSTETDASGNYINPVSINVVWDLSPLHGFSSDNVSAVDDDVLQEWIVPAIYREWYWYFSFERNEEGEYAVRWRPHGWDWSGWGICVLDLQ